MRPAPSLRGTYLASALVDVPVLGQKLAQTPLTFGQGRLRDLAGELDPMRLGHRVQNRDGGTIAEKNTLGVDSDGISHETFHSAGAKVRRAEG